MTRTILRICSRIGFVAASTLVLLEFTLQVGALLVWSLSSDRQAVQVAGPADDRAATIACFGDSYTFGMGATSRAHSYPAVLEQTLRARLPDAKIRVANRGYPARDSRRVLESIHDEIDELNPRIACVLVGTNDFWNWPKPLDLSELANQSRATADTFRFECRTLRLLRTFRAWRARKRAERPVVDEVDRGSLPDDAVPTKPLTTGRPRSESAAIRERETEIEEALSRRQYRRVLELTTEQLGAVERDSETAARTLRQRAHAATESGETEIADDALDELAALYAAQPTEHIAADLIAAMAQVGEQARLLDIVVDATDRHADSARIWHLRARADYRRGHNDAARTAIERAVTLADAKATRARRILRGRIHRLHAEILASANDLDGAIRATLRSHEASREVGETRRLIQRLTRSTERARFLETVHEVVSDPDAARELVALHDAIRNSGETAARLRAVFQHHLEQIVVRCRSAGAQVVFVGYPAADADWLFHRAARGVAERTGATWVATKPYLDAASRERPNVELFVADGHCNDAGYALMAQAVADALVERGYW